jgi:O-antigen/teichoic acid export membrane protein
MLARARTIFSQSAVYSFGNALAQGIKFFLLPLYTQFLTPADYGILAVVGTYEVVLGIFMAVGLQGAITRLHYDFKGDEEERRRFYGTAFLFLMGSGLLLALLVGWQGAFLFRLLFPGIDYLPYGRLGTWIAFFSLGSIIPLVLFRVREQAWLFIAATSARLLLSTLLIIYFVAFRGQGALGSLQGQLIANAALFIVFTIVSLRSLRFSFRRSTLRAILSMGLPLVPHQLSGWVLSLSDRVVLTHFVTLGQLGIYSLGYRMAMVVDLMFTSFNLAWGPLFYRIASEDGENAPRTFARLSTYYAIIAFTLVLGALLLFEEVVVLMARPAYYPSIPIMKIVILGFLLHGFYFMVVNQLFYAKKVARLPLYSGAAALVNIGLNLLTIPTFGIAAAAWNTVAGYTVLFVLVFIEAKKVYPIPYEYGRLARLAAAAGVIYLAGSLVQLESSWLSLLARALVVLAYPLVLFAIRFYTPREISGMRMLVRQALKPARKGA